MYAWLFIILLFVALIVVGITYNKIVPPTLELIKSKRFNPWHLVTGLFFIFMSLIPLSQKSGFLKISPGAQSSERWGAPVHNYLLFAVGFLCGILCLITAFRKNSKIDINDDTPENICVSCGIISNSRLAGEKFCSKCGGNIEGISGVMERHPELLKIIKKNS